MTQLDILETEKKKEAQEKLKRIEGRIKGLSRMIDEGRSSTDVLMQLSAAHEALRQEI